MPISVRSKKRHSCEHFRVLLLLILLNGPFLYFMLFPPYVNAGDIQLATEFNYLNSNIETTNNETGAVAGSDFTSFDQNYHVSLSRELYPFLTLRGGSSFELDKSTFISEEITIERKDRSIRPFASLDLRSPLYSAGISYSENQLRNEITDRPVSKDFQESLDLSFTYRPAGLPLFRIFHNRVHNYDDPVTTDTINALTTAKVSYSLKNNPVSYTYGREETTDRLTGLEVLRETHEGTAGYSRGFFNDRVYMDAGYRVRYNLTTVPGGATEGAESPLSPSEGLFSADNTPQNGPALTTLTALIDGNLTASTGINIGWSASAEEARGTGLDFGFSQSVDRILVYVDRNVPAAAASSFSWSVYTSPDNTDTSVWTLHTVVLPASFAVFQNRFEMTFPEVSARFIKVVVNPLSATFIGTNPDLENIFVTEIEATVVSIATENVKTTDISHNISFGLAGQLSDKTRVGYNLQFTQRETDTDPAVGRYSLSNSVYVNHIFNRILTGSARVSRDESVSTSDNEVDTKSVGYDYSANLMAAYLETLSQTLTMGFNEREEDDEKQTASSIFLRTNAALYKGWDAFLDVGFGWDKPADAGGITSAFLTTQTSVVPNDKISFDATYSMITSEDREEGTSNTRRSYDMRTSYYPYRNLSFSFQISVEEQSNQDERQILQRYVASWSPLRGGDLQLFLTYSESRRPSDGQEERNMGPVMKWEISRYASLDVSYFYATVETPLETTDLSTMTAKLSMTF